MTLSSPSLVQDFYTGGQMINWLWRMDLTPGVKKETPQVDNFYALGSKLCGLLMVTSLLLLALT